MTQPPQYKKFDFGTVYDTGGRVTATTPKEKKFYTPEEVEAIRQQAHTQGELSAMARAQMAQAQAVQALAEAAGVGLEALNGVLSQHKEECVQLALVCAQKIAAQALELFPEAPVKAALEALGEEISGAPRLVITAASPDANMQKAVREAAALTGFSGAIVFRDQPGGHRGAFEIQWPEGRAAYDPDKVFEALRGALKEVLLAEAYHKQKAG
ncbi:flagellar assembly protein FliH [Asticcacaulis sp. YBE204]|uniref:flagellar assembly protein FliH n=1 Tax=Asticcacaulis sp. YBE204 TaxID=1282363 RepID=UPI0003C3FCB3|nr:flagellar assembly protein FliH [Asticcacaulis sp. YBE204]ESQ81369.1 flagellar assembly protein FliH [Asticcacaulis sp. YBE204]